MESINFPVSTLQSFQNLSVSPTTIDFGQEFATNKTPEQFVSVANQFLDLHSSNKVEKFNLYFYPSTKFLPDINTWLAYVVRRGVEEVNLNFSMEMEESKNKVEYFPLLTRLFECKTLTRLSLSHCDFGSSPNFAGFISNCPLLDSLIITNCSSVDTVVFSSSSLRKLTIVNTVWEIFQTEISAPKLESFVYYGVHIFGDSNLDPFDSFIDISSLSDAFICGVESSEPEHDFVKLAYDLRHVKVLTVCTYTLLRVTIFEDDEKLPILLQNLKELQLLLGTMSSADLKYIYTFFRSCPSPFIEKLFLQLSTYSGDQIEGLYGKEEVEDPRDINFYHLKVIKVSNFKGCKGEMRLVGFLLQSAVNLESMVLVAPPNVFIQSMDIEQTNISGIEPVSTVDLMSLRSQLSLLLKASPRANIVLCEHSEDDMSLSPTHTEYFEEY